MTPQHARIAATMLAACSLTGVAGADITPRPLEGEYMVYNPLSDNAPGEDTRDTHMNFRLTGEAARTLYASMQVTPTENACLRDGTLGKTIGGLQCLEFPAGRGYNCYFSMNINAQTIETGVQCDAP